MIAILITILMNLGLLTSKSSWNELSKERQEQYKQEIIIEDMYGI